MPEFISRASETRDINCKMDQKKPAVRVTVLNTEHSGGYVVFLMSSAFRSKVCRKPKYT